MMTNSADLATLLTKMSKATARDSSYSPYLDYWYVYLSLGALFLAGLFILGWTVSLLRKEWMEKNAEIAKNNKKYRYASGYKEVKKMSFVDYVQCLNVNVLVVYALIVLALIGAPLYVLDGRAEKYTAEFHREQNKIKNEILGELKRLNIEDNYIFFSANKIPVSAVHENIAIKGSQISIVGSLITIDGKAVNCSDNLPLDRSGMQKDGIHLEHLPSVYGAIKSEPFVYRNQEWGIHKALLKYLPQDAFVKYLGSCYSQYNKTVSEEREREMERQNKMQENERGWKLRTGE